MKHTQNISLANQPLVIDDDAYKVLSVYLNKVECDFDRNDFVEIQKDIELRIIELLTEAGWHNLQVISLEHLEPVLNQIGDVKDESKEPDVNLAIEKTNRRLFRDQDNGQLLGVCQGFGEYFGTNPVIIRLVFIMLTIISGGIFILIYIVLAYLLPNIRTEFDRAQLRGLGRGLNKVFNVDKTDSADKILLRINHILKTCSKFVKSILKAAVQISVFVARLIILSISIGLMFGIIPLIWLDSYKDQLNLFVSNFTFTEKIGLSLFVVTLIASLLLTFISLRQVNNKLRTLTNFVPYFVILVTLLAIQIPPVSILSEKFNQRNQDYQVLYKKYLNDYNFSAIPTKPDLSINLDGVSYYRLLSSKTDKLTISGSTYKWLVNDFKIDAKNNSIITPDMEKYLKASAQTCVTCTSVQIPIYSPVITIIVPSQINSIRFVQPTDEPNPAVMVTIPQSMKDLVSNSPNSQAVSIEYVPDNDIDQTFAY